MNKFRKKPPVIEAVQFDGKLSSVESLNIPECSQDLGSDSIYIETAKGLLVAYPTDWIVKITTPGLYPEYEVEGDELFKEVYEPAE